jgi:hypothetical protein
MRVLDALTPPSNTNSYALHTMASTLFLKQSAKDACQSIIDAIHKCNMYAERRERTQAAAAAAASSSAVLPPAAACLASPEAAAGDHVARPHHHYTVSNGEELHEISLDHILSNVPYKDMLQDLFGLAGASSSSSSGTMASDRDSSSSSSSTPPSSPPRASGERQDDQNVDHGDRHKKQQGAAGGERRCRQQRRCLKAPQIPVVTKSYEESFMREPMWDYERPCIMGGNCECNYLGTRPGDGFTAVEFVLPSEVCLSAKDRQPQMCVLCHRKLVHTLFYDIIYAGSPYRGVIQRYGNICNQVGLLLGCYTCVHTHAHKHTHLCAYYAFYAWWIHCPLRRNASYEEMRIPRNASYEEMRIPRNASY